MLFNSIEDLLRISDDVTSVKNSLSVEILGAFKDLGRCFARDDDLKIVCRAAVVGEMVGDAKSKPCIAADVEILRFATIRVF